MTAAPAGGAFTATFEETFDDSRIGSAVLHLNLSCTPAGAGDWQATGTAEIVRGSTYPPLRLSFPVQGTLTAEANELPPPTYVLQLHSHATDGTSLEVKLSSRTDIPPSSAPELTFTGEYTWTSGETNTVTTTVQMVRGG